MDMGKEAPPAASTRLRPEFIALMALMISIVALSTDAMLPALAVIGRDLGVTEANSNQLVVTAFFLGLAFGQLFFGPLSDSIGRKPAINLGFAIFAVGCVLSLTATDMTMMLAGRVLQGIGAAGPRTVAVALIRDQYAGRAMARIMSFVMAVFILVPVAAPALGQGIMVFADWHGIFWLFLALAIGASIWLTARQPETLPREKRRAFSLARIGKAAWEVCRTRAAIGSAAAAGLIFSAMIGYLTSSQQIFQDTYGVGDLFPLYFAGLAIGIGGASITNARLVMRLGMRRLTVRALVAIIVLAAVFFAVAASMAGVPPLWAFMVYGIPTFFCMGILFGNLNAMAMEPLGHIAGVGSAVVASLTGFISLALGSLIGQSYDGTVLPLVAGYGVLGVLALLLVRWVGKGREDA
ncbi:MAG: multidrug effflux MFS transporter [Alphaproteobacteria bacterium]